MSIELLTCILITIGALVYVFISPVSCTWIDATNNLLLFLEGHRLHPFTHN
jgi:hypothetical protein